MGLPDVRISRRALLGAGGGVAALAAVPAALRVAGGARGAARPAATGVRYVVTDRRHPPSLAFARGYVAQGSVPLDVVDGLTRMWQQSLLPLWRARGGAVAGLTTRSAWTCLAEQARSHGLRTRVLAPVDVDDGHPDTLVSWTIS